ncbi:hypothetical protein AU384_12110 [Bacillus halotolerans]|nr:hypothetical protein AU384_12110 [Bacillus halotolerans]
MVWIISIFHIMFSFFNHFLSEINYLYFIGFMALFVSFVSKSNQFMGKKNSLPHGEGCFLIMRTAYQ